MAKKSDRITLGWREWVQLPELGLVDIKAKVDTGARTSALHAFEVTPFEEDGRRRVEFRMHPNQRDSDTVVVCSADVVDQRTVKDSGGHAEERWVISTPIIIGGTTWPVEITLTSRDDMMFRMLLGRTALKDRFMIDPAKEYLTGRELEKSYSYSQNRNLPKIIYPDCL